MANFGQSGYGPQQELVVLRRYGMGLRPRVVLWFFFEGNDLDNVARYDGLRKLAASPDVPKAPFQDRSFVRNALWAAARLTTTPRRVASPEALRYGGSFMRADGRQEIVYLDENERPTDPRVFEVAAGILEEAKRLALDGSARFLLINVPQKFRVYSGLLTLKPDSPVLGWRLNNLPDILAQWSRERDMEFLDMTPVLRAAAEKGESVYLPDDNHWSPAGHRLVADAIVDRLRASGALGASSTK